MLFRTTHKGVVALGVIAALGLAACSGGSKLSRVGGKLSGKKEAVDEDDEETDAKAKALSDEDAIAFLQDNCTSCHGKGADLHSTWPIPDKDNLSVETLQNMDTISTAYQALVNKYTKAPLGHRPSPMPPGSLDDEKKAALEGLIYWFQLNMPSVVKEAEDTYGANDQFGSTLSVNLNYQCVKRSLGRNYMFRLFNQALGRFPTQDELDKNLPEKERSKPLSDERRNKLAKLVTTGDLKSQFFQYGLKVFAQRVGGAGAIKTNAAFGINDVVVGDLKEEFYQLVLKYVEEKSYKDILTMPKVMVTANTFGFYNDATAPCANPGPNTWAECDLAAKRSNFFGTLGFLRSTPSSFLASNNNYKRGGEIHAILRGERLMAQTDGPKGAEAAPIPECLNSKDVRVVLNDPAKPDGDKAPRGALAVPRQGAVCQGCHLNKYLGVASFAFRPFDENGIAFPAGAFNVADPKNPYADMVKAAVDPSLKNMDPASGSLADVDVPLLQSFLAEHEAGSEQCITNRSGSKTLKAVKTIGDLVDFMMGDGRVLVHGLARYIPSAVSNMPLTNQEIITSLSKGYEEGDGKLLPVFEAYFKSETFSCAVEDEEGQ